MYLLVGTAKGLFRYQSNDRTEWKALGPVLGGDPIYTSAYDAARGILLASVNSEFYGPSIRRSHDWGETWDTGGSGLAYAPDDAERVTRVWSIRPTADVIYAGVEASGLFRSFDGGDTWEEVRALRQHPTHETWGPGFGGKCLHTIAPDPFNPDRLYIACSAGGAYRTNDRGKTWEPINAGLRADFMPEDQQYPEAGQCVHKIWVSPSQAGRMWLQNHGGVYRSDDGGDTWNDVGQSLPSDFGFPVVGDPHHPDRAYVIPLEGWPRWAPDNILAVHRTDDAGQHWEPLHKGLPSPTYVSVLRDAMTADTRDRLGLYFGTTSGSLYHSNDSGTTWNRVAQDLPRIYSVVVAEE